VGGGARNRPWTEIRMRRLAVPARPSLSEHAAVGTARLAWRGFDHAD
jgi:D-ribulokinase